MPGPTPPTAAYGPTIAVVIVNYRTPQLALDALAAIAGERAALPDLRAVLVDGGSGDGSAAAIARGLDDPRFAGWAEPLALDINGGFGWANNQAMQRLLQGADPPDYILLLNPDTIAEPGAVAKLAAVLDAYPRCGAVGSLLLEPDGRGSGSAFSRFSVASELFRGLRIERLRRLARVPPSAFLDETAREVDWATGASVMLRSEALREVGLFDTGFFLYFEEVELMARMRHAGWTIRYEPASRVTHVGGAATGVNATNQVKERPALPPYWYGARRRMLALTLGPGRALAASFAFLAGHMLHRVRKTIGGARGAVPVRREARGLIAHGLRATAADRVPAIARWNDPPGRAPAWMAAP